jgi:ATP-dependent Clp protease ATP-binding subunit ClpA
MERAVKESRRRQQNYVSLEHLVHALGAAEADLFDAFLLDLGVDAREPRALVKKRLASGLQHRGAGVRVAPEVNSYLKAARRRALSFKRDGIESGDLLVALAQDKRGFLVELLRSFGADADVVAWAAHRRVVEAEAARAGKSAVVYVRGAHSPTDYAEGDTVRIKSGPFASFTGKVAEVLKESATIKVIVQIFGRTTPIDINFSDAEKITFAR